MKRKYRLLQGATWQTYLSMAVMGLGQLFYGQIVKGLCFLGCLGALAAYFIRRGFTDLIGFFTLGTNEENLWLGIPGDNSLTMLILGLFAIFLLLFFVILHVVNVRDTLYTAREMRSGKPVPKLRDTLETAADRNFHLTALSLPALGVAIFSILPIVFMICIAFTDLGGDVVYPKLASWSLSAWRKILSLGKIGATFFKILRWNVVWALCSTFLNFTLGLMMALLLNKRNVRGSKIFRAFPILAYAIPGFISMLGFKYMFSQSGPINYYLDQAGMMRVFFLTNDASAKWWARGIGLFVNAWISTPSIMLMTTGVLSNVSADLYEAASLDGASPIRQFRHITLPFVLFSTAPVLIGQLVGNFNNFGVFFFLRGGVISNYADYFLSSDTDLLINWLYKLSVDNNYYAIGAAISLVIFLITAAMSLAVYVRTAAYQQEDTYQ